MFKQFVQWIRNCFNDAYLIDDACIETKTDTLQHKAEF